MCLDACVVGRPRPSIQYMYTNTHKVDTYLQHTEDSANTILSAAAAQPAALHTLLATKRH